MRTLSALVVAAFVCAAPMIATPAYAVAPIHVTFGASWDPPSQSLQHVVDDYIGVPGALDVHADFIGAHLGDLDPWFWVGSSFPALMITEVAGNANTNQLGWYRETGAKPILDGIDDGVVFAGSQGANANVVVTFPAGTTRFGFYLDPAPGNHSAHPQFFTNRFFNDLGPAGAGAVHSPFDGDVQALVFDVSRWKGPDTWLVCFEDLDSGRAITPCCTGTDDDYNDMVFQVTALGATPAQTLSFGELKARFNTR
jgi:hypothetical protein